MSATTTSTLSMLDLFGSGAGATAKAAGLSPTGVEAAVSASIDDESITSSCDEALPAYPHLEGLPDVCLLEIIPYLDGLNAFSRVNKRFYLMTQDPYVRSLYFLRRYGPRLAFFMSIRCHPRALTVQVAQNLHRQGAHISRLLGQLVTKNYSQNRIAIGSWETFGSKRFTIGLSLQTFVFLMQVCCEKYGSSLWPRSTDDWESFDEFMMKDGDSSRRQVLELVECAQFTPLPLCEDDRRRIVDTFVLASDREEDIKYLEAAGYMDIIDLDDLGPRVMRAAFRIATSTTTLKPAVSYLLSRGFKFTETLLIELISSCRYDMPNPTLATLSKMPDVAPLLPGALTRVIRARFDHRPFVLVVDNMQPIYHYFPEVRDQIREKYRGLIREGPGWPLLGSRYISAYQEGMAVDVPDFLCEILGPDDEKVCGPIMDKIICFEATGGINRYSYGYASGASPHTHESVFDKLVNRGVKLRREHLQILAAHECDPTWLDKYFSTLQNQLLAEKRKKEAPEKAVMAVSQEDLRGGPSAQTCNRASRTTADQDSGGPCTRTRNRTAELARLDAEANRNPLEAWIKALEECLTTLRGYNLQGTKKRKVHKSQKASHMYLIKKVCYILGIYEDGFAEDF
ncbi:hypothetical protein YB2330_001458 [Saitoella coloradoensis]